MIIELNEADEIRNVLMLLGNSLFDQTVNTSDRLTALAEKYSSKGHVLALSCEGKWIGLCAYYDNESDAFISMLVIDSDQQHAGYGTAFLGEVLQRCRYRKISNVWLEVSRWNYRAIRFYQKIGFRIRGINCHKITLEINPLAYYPEQRE